MPPFLAGRGQATQTTSSSSSTTEEINGQPIEPEDDPAPPRSQRRRGKPKVSSAAGEFGATCRKNHECESNTCFVGSGDLGYCTAMCNSFSECPTHWECQRAGNAPQKICQQD
jgi:hypothetical protein